MSSATTKPLREYIATAEKYIDACGQLAGKPQKLSVVGSYVYWTQGKHQELYRASIADAASRGERVIVTDEPAAAPASSAKSQKEFSKEEELLRERMRSLVTGISTYHVRDADGTIFFVSGLDLYVYYPEGPRAKKAPLKVFDFLDEEAAQRFTTTPKLHVQFGTRADGKQDFQHIFFVHDNNLYAAELVEQPLDQARPLRVSAVAITTIGDAHHPCGVADYVVQEEFDRYTGHYANEKYVVFSYTDTMMMRHVALLDNVDGAEDGVEKMPYSRVGDPNARTIVVVYDRSSKTFRYVPSAALCEVAARSSAAFSTVEYIPRFGFKDAEHLYLTLLSRTQEELAVVSCAVSELPAITEEELKTFYDADGGADVGHGAQAPRMEVEWAQRIPWAWTDVQPGPPILFGKTHDLVLCASAESETAHYHLYCRPAGHDAAAWRPLTQGRWNVRAGSVRVLEKRHAVAFVANVDGRLKSALYTIALPDPAAAPLAAAADSSAMARHSGLDEHCYVASHCADAEHICFVASSRHRPAEIVCAALGSRQEIRTIATEPWLVGGGGAGVSDTDAGAPPPASAAEAGDDSFVVHADHQSFALVGCPMVFPSLVTVLSRRGVPLGVQLFAARTNADSPRPLVLFVYGGPHVQYVTESDFDGACRATVQALVSCGLNVAVADNQQAVCNGLRDLSVCKKNMGHFETDDYSDVVGFLTGRASGRSTDPLPAGWAIDPARVAIYGWSYGGYATLLAMSQAPDVFRLGFAGAPVGDWTLYDTGYTERYMGLLYDADDAADRTDAAAGSSRRPSAAYANSTIASFVNGFPDDLNRVFIAHGLLDENVHFQHTAHVVEAMVKAEKPYSMLVYPGERHGLRQKKESRLHHEGMLLKTMVEML